MANRNALKNNRIYISTYHPMACPVLDCLGWF